MLRHYVAHVLPGGLKAQIVAVSRQAAVQYHKALTGAIDKLVERLQTLPPALRTRPPEEREQLEADDPERAFLLNAYEHLDAIQQLSAAAVISGSKGDPPSWDTWSDPAGTRRHIARFKQPIAEDGLAFLCVCTKLLTGFDAPVEQVLYLDRPIKEHNLLQAIARVNRRYRSKRHGLVVDYYNVGAHLHEALEAYSDEDVRGALTDISRELPRLRDRHARVLQFFDERGVGDLWEGEEEAVEILAEPKERAAFVVRFEDFMESLEIVLPRPEALRYQPDARQLGKIKKRARNRYRDDTMDQVGVGAKVRALIDRHLVAEGIDPKVPPVSILDAEFEEELDALTSPRAKASEMEHAARHHIQKHRGEDPTFYDGLSEWLEAILERYEDDWDALAQQFDLFLDRLREGRREDATDLRPDVEAPFYHLLRQMIDGDLSEEDREHLQRVTVDLVGHVQAAVRQVDFWRKRAAQDDLRAWIVRRLDRHELVSFEKLEATADRIVELAKHRHTYLTDEQSN